MIIGIDASRANRERKTGTEWYSYYLIKNLAKIDKKNQYILYTDKPLRGGLLDLTNDSSRDDYKNNKQTIKSPHNNFRQEVLNWPFTYFWTLIRLSLKMLRDKPDVLFVPAHGIPLIRPKNTINTVHDIAFEIEKNLFKEEKIGSEMKWKRKIINIAVKIITLGKYGANSLDYLKWATRYSLKNSKKIISISEFTKKEITKVYGNKKNNIEVVLNGFNDKIYKKIDNFEKKKEVLEKYQIEGSYILYIGRLEKKKNTPFLVESFAKAKHFNKNIKEKLVLIGDAGFGYDEVLYTISEFGLDNEVIMPGWVDEEDLPYILSGATAFIFPTRYEGFGIPLLQAFACGVPVITSDIKSLREVGQDACLYFDNFNKDDVARAIVRVIEDEKLRKKLIENGFKRAGEFSWEKCAKETLDVIENLK